MPKIILTQIIKVSILFYAKSNCLLISQALSEKVIMKVDLGDFVSVEEREKLLEKLLTAKDSTVMLDTRHLKYTPGEREWDKLVLSAKFFAERLRRYGRKTPTIQLILPEDPFVFDLKRVDELQRVSGVKIEIL